MPNPKAERRPRGRYARLICRRCRSRKIKCKLPGLDELAPPGSPQPLEKSCERCRSLNQECIVERTTLGRPSLKHSRDEDSWSNSKSRHDGNNPPIASLEVKDHLPTASIDDLGTTQRSQTQRQRKLFRSTIEFQYFFSLVLANDRSFGATIPRSTTDWTIPLPDLVGHEIATALDAELVWHQLFLPQLPSLINLRARLESDGTASANTATNLLFALLCLIAFDTTNKLHRHHSRLKRNIQLAISSFGQEFILSPPTHPDSIIVCLLLAYYRPTAVALSQHTTHKAIKSALYLNMAFKIAERLEKLPSQIKLDFGDLMTMSDIEFEHRIADSVQGLGILSQDLTLDGLLSKPVHALQNALNSMTSHVQAYQDVVKHRHCSLKIIFQIEWATASYMMLDALKATKQNWGSAEKLYHIVEKIEEECLAQVKFCDWALTKAAASSEEILAARSILELRFHAIIGRIYGIALLYILVLKSRTTGNNLQGDPEIYAHETDQIGMHVSAMNNNSLDETSQSLLRFLGRFGNIFPDHLLAVLEKFIKCTDLRIGGVPFQSPFRDIILDILTFTRAIVENNNIRVINLDGKMKSNSDHQIEVIAECAKRMERMVASPEKSIKGAFTDGCVHAASSKIMLALLGVMKDLKRETSNTDIRQELSTMPNTSAEWMASNISEASFWESWNQWPNDGLSNLFDAEQFIFDWPSVMDLDGGMDFDLNLGPSWV